MSDDIEELLRKSVEALAAMSPAERMAMFARQRESWVRSMAPCEHGVSDWEHCLICLAAQQRGEEP